MLMLVANIGIISSYKSAVDNRNNRSRIGTELVLVPKMTGTEMDMPMYRT